jgi:hypothetical protein
MNWGQRLLNVGPIISRWLHSFFLCGQSICLLAGEFRRLTDHRLGCSLMLCTFLTHLWHPLKNNLHYQRVVLQIFTE